MAEEKNIENNSGLGATGNFIHSYIQEDLKGELNKIHTRFPPEPNGYLHIGHAKSICLNFGLANLYGGKCNLRFDDTNPTKEDVEYVESIQEDVKWLGFDWEDRLFYASSYFDKYYEVALKLIKEGKAFVDELSAEEMREYNVLPKHLDGIVSQLRVTKDVEAAVFLYQTDEENYKVSTRSASYVDVAKIAAKYGGGGHVRAAGFSVAGDPEKRLNEIIEDIREQITD